MVKSHKIINGEIKVNLRKILSIILDNSRVLKGLLASVSIFSLS